MMYEVDDMDFFITLGGEDKSKSRSNKTIMVSKMSKWDKPLNFVLSGKGRDDSYWTQAEEMHNYIRFRVNGEHNFLLENESLDTIANFYFTKKIVEENFNVSKNLNIGVITDKSHMPRSMYIGGAVFGPGATFFSFPTNLVEPDRVFLGEKALLLSLQADFKYFGVNHKTIDDYMKNIHPFHSEKPKVSSYLSIVKATNSLS